MAKQQLWIHARVATGQDGASLVVADITLRGARSETVDLALRHPDDGVGNCLGPYPLCARVFKGATLHD